jgi:predicted SprT family Zn-dependent metalloprotease
MQLDPAIDEVREIRRKISAEFGHDPRRLMAHYVEYEQQLRRAGKYHFAEAPAVEAEPAAFNDQPRKGSHS